MDLYFDDIETVKHPKLPETKPELETTCLRTLRANHGGDLGEANSLRTHFRTIYILIVAYNSSPRGLVVRHPSLNVHISECPLSISGC